MTTTTITESGITLNFPDNNFFRFENCQGYKNIQNHFREVDVCWYEQATDTLYLIELKNWGNFTLIEENDPNFSVQQIEAMKNRISTHRIEVLWKKTVDSACMFMSVLLNKPYSANIQACSPFTITNTTKIKCLSIINWTNPDVTYIATVNKKYKEMFKPYADLFDIKAFIVMTKKQAAQRFSWVS